MAAGCTIDQISEGKGSSRAFFWLTSLSATQQKLSVDYPAFSAFYFDCNHFVSIHFGCNQNFIGVNW